MKRQQFPERAFRKLLLLALLAPIASAHATGKPLLLSLSPPSQTVTEGQSVTVLLSKSGGNGRVTAAKVTTSDGSFSAAVVPGTSFTIPTKDDSIVNGTRTIIVTATASTGATAKATITELDNDAPAITWTHCAWEGGACSVAGTANVRYGSGSTWTAARSVTGSIDCSNATWGDPLVGTGKECVTDGTVAAPAPAPAPVPAPAPAPAPTSAAIYWTSCWDGSLIHIDRPCPALPASWVAAPLQASAGYARIATAAHQSPLFGRPLVAGEAVRVVGTSGELRLVQALSDLDVMELPASDLQGVAPGP